MRIAAFIFYTTVAVLGWIGVGAVAFVLLEGRMPMPRGADWWIALLPALLAVLGSWAAVRTRPRPRASSVAVEEFLRAKRRTGMTPPTGVRRDGRGDAP